VVGNVCTSWGAPVPRTTSTWTSDGLGAKDYHAAVVQEWLARHPKFHLEFLPAYSPNLNLIERRWKFLRKKAFTRWHQTFEDMEAAVSAVLDHLEEYRGELITLMTEKFQCHPQAKAVAGQSVAA
jgi:DDE superfamily endonuclease